MKDAEKLQSGVRKEGDGRGHNFSAVTSLWVVSTADCLLLVSGRIHFFKPFVEVVEDREL